MTNFEKWKATVPVEVIAKIYNLHINQEVCYLCPAYDYCMNCYDSCEQAFLEWANQEAT